MRKVLVIAEDHFGNGIVELIGNSVQAKLLTYRQWKALSFFAKVKTISKYNYIHHFGGTDSKTLINSCRILRKKLIVHFICTDVYHILNCASRHLENEKKQLLKVWKLAATGKNLISELETVGIGRVEYVPFNVYFNNPPELGEPEPKTALVYIPRGREEFYGIKVIKGYLAKFPDIKFYVIGNEGIDGCRFSNVHYLGWIDNVIEYLDRCKIYIRHTVHDVMPPILVRQAFLRGRHVMYNHDFPFCHRFGDEIFIDLMDNWYPNIAGQNLILQEYSREKIAGGFLNLYS